MADPGQLKLAMPTEREIVLTRSFDVPCHLVFDAFTRPELLERWLLGPAGWPMVICEVELRIGGSYRFRWNDGRGVGLGMRGVYREIERPARIVRTEAFDSPLYPGEALVTTLLAEEGGWTSFTGTIRYESRDTRDAVLRSIGEESVAASYDTLAELLTSTRTRRERRVAKEA